MSFQSFHFFVFFLAVFALNQLLRGRPGIRKSMLLVASYYFYMCWDWRFAGLLLLVTGVNYLAGQRIAIARSHREKQFWLVSALVIGLGVLGYFKYADFFIANFAALLNLLGVPVDPSSLNLVLPIGISFFTFQSLSYVLDVYRGSEKPCRDLRDFALFVAFFPTLLAGPITRARQFLPQLEAPLPPNVVQAEAGLTLMLRGFIKKIAFADVLAMHLVNPAFADPAQFSPLFLLLAVYGYSFQIYMDFSGYTDIARGAAKMLGFELMENFDRPYWATSVSNFWQRWHISMSSFFRDYLFFSLGGSKYGNVYFNTLVTFIAIGFWHDDGWNFIAYGCIHGLLVCFDRSRRVRRERLGLPPVDLRGFSWLWRVVLTFHIVALSRILFRAPDLGSAWKYMQAMARFDTTATPLSAVGLVALLLSLLLHSIPRDWSGSGLELLRRAPVWLQSGLICASVYLLVALSTGRASFVYFQF